MSVCACVCVFTSVVISVWAHMGTWVHVYKHVCRGPKFALDIFLKKALPPKLLRHGLSLKLKLIPAGLASLLQGSLAVYPEC